VIAFPLENGPPYPPAGRRRISRPWTGRTGQPISRLCICPRYREDVAALFATDPRHGPHARGPALCIEGTGEDVMPKVKTLNLTRTRERHGGVYAIALCLRKWTPYPPAGLRTGISTCGVLAATPGSQGRDDGPRRCLPGVTPPFCKCARRRPGHLRVRRHPVPTPPPGYQPPTWSARSFEPD
jgi:hypothetical protein